MAQALSLKDRIGVAILKHKVKKTLRGYNKEFKEIMDANGVKTDYKFSLFIIYFISQITNQNVKPSKLLRELDEKGVVGSYVKLSNALSTNNNDMEHVSAKQASDEFAKGIIKFIGDKKSDLDKNKLRELIFDVIKLFRLTEGVDQFDISAIKNLNDNYEKKVSTAISITQAVGKVHDLLIDTLPEESNYLIVLINNLLHKLIK
jgi:hypothetical protein